MKRYSELFTVIFLNGGAYFYAENIPGINIAEMYAKILVLLATFIYTLIKIIMLLKSMKGNKNAKDLEEK